MKWFRRTWCEQSKLNNFPKSNSRRLVQCSLFLTLLAVPATPWLKTAFLALMPQALAQVHDLSQSKLTESQAESLAESETEIESNHSTRLSELERRPGQSPLESEAESRTESHTESRTEAKQPKSPRPQAQLQPQQNLPAKICLPRSAQPSNAATSTVSPTVSPTVTQPSTQSAPQSTSATAEEPASIGKPRTANQPAPATASEPLTQMGLSLAENVAVLLKAQASSQPYQISSIARLARVPVMMYHDVLPQKQVFFDVTPLEFEANLKLIRDKGLTPISLDQLVNHLKTGLPLPAKPILLSFDDGYQGHYDYVYPLLKKYSYPGLFAIYTDKVGKRLGRSSLTWQQIREMAADPLVTIASHSVSHPSDLREMPEDRLRDETVESKRILESQLGISIKYFVYPEGKYNERVKQWLKMAGYQAALTMDDTADRFAGASQDLLSIDRIGQANLAQVIDQAYGGPALPSRAFQFDQPVQLSKITTDKVPLLLASGGRPTTIHADSRYQVSEIIAKTNALAAVDGGFFSLEYLDSNVMVGPVYSQNNQKTSKFVAGNPKEIRRIAGRPLVLISPTQVKYIPFDPEKHNTLTGLQAEMPDLTDAFVAAAWLVRDGQPQAAESFGNLFDFNAARDRAFWGVDQAGRPTVGVSGDYIDSVSLGESLSRAGLRDAVMLDSGASASLVFAGKSQMSYEPRPVPHVVALVPPTGLQVVSHPCK